MTRKNRELDSPVIGHGGLFTDDNIGGVSTTGQAGCNHLLL